MRQRTRFDFDPDMYKDAYNTDQWVDHIYRVRVSRSILESIIGSGAINSVADLSAGDGKISGNFPINSHLGDISTKNCIQNNFKYYGPIEETIFDIPQVDLFVLSETLEHLEDPENVLRLISYKSKVLFLSTPLEEPINTNPEHLWSWGKDDIQQLLEMVGFINTILYSELNFTMHGVRYQIWLVTK